MTSGKTAADSYEGVVQMVEGGRVDGIILLYSMIDDQIMEYLTEKNISICRHW